MRILIAGTSLLSAYGGPAFSVSRLAQALAAEGAEVGLWAPDGSAATTDLLPAGGPVRRLTGAASQAVEALNGPDLIHDNGIWLPHNHQLAQLARRRGVPRLVSTRGMLEPWAMNHKRWKKAFAWLTYQRRDLANAQRLHATAEEEAAHIGRLALDVPVVTIPNGVDLPDLPVTAKAEPIRRGPTALFLGRLYPVKGLPMLIEAWGRVRPPGWTLQIAGPDEAGHRSDLERAIAEHGLGEQVSFSGPLDAAAKRQALLAADLLVLPSHSESFGMVIAEALAHGLPVLTTTAVPWPWLAQRDCGWRVEPTSEALAEGLRTATSSDRATLRAMGGRGRDFVAAAFGWSDVAKRFLSLYAEIIGAASLDSGRRPFLNSGSAEPALP